MKPNILFMGSSEYSIPILESLACRFEIKAVFTQPDKPSGRGKKLEPSKFKKNAEKIGIKVFQPKRFNINEVQTLMDSLRIDLIVVAAYGKILPKWILEYPKFGALNVHASLLPRWRGASPIQTAILKGDETTGVTIMKMDEGIDTGDILTCDSLEIERTDTYGSLSKKLAILGANLISTSIHKYIDGEIVLRKQQESLATYAGLIKKENGRLDFYRSAEYLERQIRAFNPWPICFFEWDSNYIRVFEANIINNDLLKPSQRSIINKYPCIGTAGNTLLLKKVQPAGKNVMDGKAFLNGMKGWL